MDLDTLDAEATASTSGSESEATSSVSSPSSTSSTSSPILSHLSESAVKIVSNLSNYLALGCLCFEDFTRLDEPEQQGYWEEVTTFPLLSFDSADLATSLARLLRSGWARLQYRRCELRPELLIFRIYLLYNDVGLGAIDRGNPTLLSAISNIVASVDLSPGLWNGRYDQHVSCRFDMWATRDLDNSSLFYMFNKVPSPNPNTRDISEQYAREGLEDLLDLDHDVAGLKTCLYPYQRRSAGAMMHREAASRIDLDVRLEQRSAADGTLYYYSPREMQFLKEPKYQEAARGGILAETMGYGKTVICLALIVATKNYPSKMPEAYATIPLRSRVGSLVDMSISAINRRSVPYKVELDRIQKATGAGEEMSICQSLLQHNPPSYEIPSEPVRWNRKTILKAPQHITMASTTIVVVPQNLCKQWTSEINKHVEEGVLKVLVMDDRKKPLPNANVLLEYDVILFTRNRFDLELQDGQADDGRRMPKNAMNCRCTYIGASRKPDCRCLTESDLYSSPLKELHFKRIIVDEGHFFSSGGRTRTILVADKLVKADHRWVVSGTPAKELLGVEVDPQSSDFDRDTALDLRREFDVKLDKGGAIDSLNSLASGFLRATPWKTSEGKDYLYRHEDRRERTFSGFSMCLRRMLESIVIKTRPEDYDRDIALPPLHHKIVTLKPSFYDKLTANLFVLVLTANAVTSERTDTDYLFHKNSTSSRLQLVRNLRQSAFFWSGFSEADVLASMKNSNNYLAKEDCACSAEDRELLIETLRCTQDILSSQGWVSMSRSHELGVYVQQWPADTAEHWTFDGSTAPLLLTGISQLLEAQTFVNQRLAHPDPGEGLAGVGIKSLAVLRQEPSSTSEGADASAKPLLSKAGVPVSSIDGEPSLLRRGSHYTSGKQGSPRKSQSRPFKVTKPRQDSKIAKRRPSKEKLHGNTALLEEAISNVEQSQSRLAADSPYSQARIVGTTSAKLSYLISEISRHYRDEKILVFYSGDNAAYYISQFLELLDIKHEIYAKSLSGSLKAKYVVAFQEEDDLRVLLMDVGQAAFGLNLCAASRVWFLNPVCKPDVEAQALKRAHRIGQTRPVMCETLILEGSIEQAMHERSQKMTRAEHLVKALEDDGGIRAIIQNARLLTLSDEEKEPGAGQMATLGKAEPLWNRPSLDDGQHAIPTRKSAGLIDITDPNEPDRMVLDDE